MKYRYGDNVFSTQITRYHNVFKHYIDYKLIIKIKIFTDNCDDNVSLLKNSCILRQKQTFLFEYKFAIQLLRLIYDT